MNETKPNSVLDTYANKRKLSLVAKKMLNVEQVRGLIRKRQGERSASEFAKELGISPAYLSDVYLGRRDPGDKILSKLSIQRKIVYEQVA
jgi:transcriptional regulator with XRE-family HTH domain